MIEVKNRSPESWGPLAKCSDDEFNRIINNSRGNTKDLIKKAKKLKPFKVTFKKHWHSNSFEIMAENELDVASKAREFFKDNVDTIGFKETPRCKYHIGYDTISYSKVR